MLFLFCVATFVVIHILVVCICNCSDQNSNSQDQASQKYDREECYLTNISFSTVQYKFWTDVTTFSNLPTECSQEKPVHFFAVFMAVLHFSTFVFFHKTPSWKNETAAKIYYLKNYFFNTSFLKLAELQDNFYLECNALGPKYPTFAHKKVDTL